MFAESRYGDEKFVGLTARWTGTRSATLFDLLFAMCSRYIHELDGQDLNSKGMITDERSSHESDQASTGLFAALTSAARFTLTSEAVFRQWPFTISDHELFADVEAGTKSPEL